MKNKTITGRSFSKKSNITEVDKKHRDGSLKIEATINPVIDLSMFININDIHCKSCGYSLFIETKNNLICDNCKSLYFEKNCHHFLKKTGYKKYTCKKCGKVLQYEDSV